MPVLIWLAYTFRLAPPGEDIRVWIHPFASHSLLNNLRPAERSYLGIDGDIQIGRFHFSQTVSVVPTILFGHGGPKGLHTIYLNEFLEDEIYRRDRLKEAGVL